MSRTSGNWRSLDSRKRWRDETERYAGRRTGATVGDGACLTAACVPGFLGRIGEWWPSVTHSIAGEDVATVVMECREGGRILERHKDGGEAPWGVIRTWDPPERLVFSWNPSYEARPETEVEVSFIVVSDTETRVELEHRDWGVLGEPGRAMRDQYEQGWPVVLDKFVEFVSA